MKPLRILLVLLLYLSCTSPRVFYDYDEKVNFSAFTTYNFLPDLQTGLSELDEERILASLQAELSNRGYSRVAAPDFLVNIFSEEFQEANRNNIGVGVGGTGRNVGVGISGGIPLGGPETYLRLTFDIVDAARDELIWQAVVERKFDRKATPEKRKAIFDKMVIKALENFPPKG